MVVNKCMFASECVFLNFYCAIQPVVEEELRQRPAAETWAKLNLESPLHCPHDMSFQLDFRDDLPTLLKPCMCFIQLKLIHLVN